MKRIFTSLAIIIGCVSLVQAQVVIKQETHGFNSGLEHSSQQVKYQNPGEAGRNVVWDFSNVELPQQGITSSAEMGKDYTKSNVKVMRDDNVTFFYNITASGNEYYGYEAGNSKLTYTTPILKTVYPQSFGTFFEGNFEGTRSYGKSVSEVKGYYSTHADAEGTIILPDGKSYPALRIHTIERTDSENGSGYEIDKYLWYLQDARFPVFVSTRVFSVKQDGTRIAREKKSHYAPDASLRSDTEMTGIENINSSLAYSVSPNPFVNTIQVSYALPSETNVNIDLYNMKGVKLFTLVANELQSGNISFTKDISQYTLAQDTYLLKIQFGDKVYTQKLVKAVK